MKRAEKTWRSQERNREVLRDENERKTAGGREMGWRDRQGDREQEGCSRDGKERSIATFAFYARNALAVAATRRSIDAATSDVVRSLSSCLPSPLLSVATSLLRMRGWNY